MRFEFFPEAITADWLLGENSFEGSDELIAQAIIAIGADSRADESDRLPDPDSIDRRGWWADTDAELLHDGWPVGCRLWILDRAKITSIGAAEGALAGRIHEYLRQAFEPFRQKRIITRYTIEVERTGLNSMAADVNLYRGDRAEIALRFQDLWSGIKG